jgi:hypothetical protein
MQLPRVGSVRSAVLDDPGLVLCAGLIPVLGWPVRAGLTERTAECDGLAGADRVPARGVDCVIRKRQHRRPLPAICLDIDIHVVRDFSR